MIVASDASPVASGVQTFAALFFISIGVLLVLRYYLSLRSTPASFLVPIFFSLWLPAGIVLLVPIDLASSARTEDDAARGVWLPENLLLTLWKIAYWLTFALTWLILPVLGEYSDAGYREPRDRLMHSVRENFQYYAKMAGAGLVGLAYVFLSYGVSPTALKGLVMALAYCWGLVLAIYLMGHGLVSVPRSLIRSGSVSSRLRRLQSQAPQLHEQMEDAVLELEDVEVQILELSRRKAGSAERFRDWIEELAEMANVSAAGSGSGSVPPSPSFSRRTAGHEDRLSPTVVTEKYLAGLARRLGRAKQTRSRLVAQWCRLVDEASRTQAILDSAPSRRLDYMAASSSSQDDAWRMWWTRSTILTPYTRHLLHYRVAPAARVALGSVLAAASACIVWSEVIRVVLPGLSVIRPSVVHHRRAAGGSSSRGEVGFGGQVVAALWITYMCTAALSSVAEVKAWRGRVLVRRNTAHEAAFWYAANVARLSIPLSYNFMTLLAPDVYTRTAFYDFLGRLVNLTPLGRWFDVLFPALVLVPVSATLFGLYGRAKRLFGLDVDMVDADADADSAIQAWREGRDLIERELGGGGGSTVHRREEAFERLGVAVRPQPGRPGRPGRTVAVRGAPVLSVPPVRGPVPPRTPPVSSSPGILPVTRRVPTAPWTDHENGGRGGEDDNDEDESFLNVLGHRMKNTVDTMGTPRWLRDVGRSISRPKWIGGGRGDDDDGDYGDANDDLGSSSSSRSDIRSWFGGSGRIRI